MVRGVWEFADDEHIRSRDFASCPRRGQRAAHDGLVAVCPTACAPPCPRVCVRLSAAPWRERSNKPRRGRGGGGGGWGGGGGGGGSRAGRTRGSTVNVAIAELQCRAYGVPDLVARRFPCRRIPPPWPQSRGGPPSALRHESAAGTNRANRSRTRRRIEPQLNAPEPPPTTLALIVAWPRLVVRPRPRPTSSCPPTRSPRTAQYERPRRTHRCPGPAPASPRRSPTAPSRPF